MSSIDQLKELSDFIGVETSDLTLYLKGEKGDKGDRGEIGPIGPQGVSGMDGKDGKDGKSIVGPVGEQGLAGIDGKDGQSIVGPQGPAGKDGKDIDEILLQEIKDRLEKLEKRNTMRPLGASVIVRHIDEIVPTGAINGINKIFTLPKAPNPALSLKVILNGARQQAGGGDFTLDNRTITFVTAPPTNSTLICDLRY